MDSSNTHQPHPPLGSGACRVFTALTRLAAAAADGTVRASYDEIQAASACARATVARGLADLERAGLIRRTHAYKGRGGYAYTLTQPSNSSLVHSFNSSLVQPPDLVLGTGTGGGTRARDFSESPEPEEVIESAGSAESPAVQRARALLREFNVGEPTQTDLAKALEPRFETDEAAAPTVRKICERTREDWHRGWARNRVGLTVTRIRRFVAGEQLSFLSDLGQPEKASGDKQARSQRRRATTRLPQVTYTDDQRAAAEERARQRRMERERQRAARNQEATS